jgi:hypothetical protein
MITQTKKRVRIILADGRIYSVSGHDIAHDRATYYAKQDKSTTYESEYEFTARDDYKLKDWLFSNMNWWQEPSLRIEKLELPPPNGVEVVGTDVIEER